jgi:voltage-gated potassium channel
MTSLRRIINDTDTWQGRAFDIVVQLLIVVSLLTFSLETLPGISTEMRRWLGAAEYLTVLVFTAEYAARLACAENRIRFVFSFFGLIDLISILPFYLATGVDLRAVRAFRLLRLVRILKLVRYSAAVQRFHRALLIAREELVLFGFLTLIVLYLASVGIWYFEREAQPQAFASVFHAMWWSMVTLSTVGYGQVVPITTGGRVFTGLVLAAGLGVVAVPPGIVASALGKARELDDDKQ